MISVRVTTQGELAVRLDQVPQRLRAAVAEKLGLAIESAYTKAVLQFSNGKYSATAEIEHGVEQLGSLLIGYIEPVTVKAKVQETGGKGSYIIEAVNAKTLRFFWDKVGAVVFPKSVLHPPLEGKHYIENALRAEVIQLNDELAEILPRILR